MSADELNEAVWRALGWKKNDCGWWMKGDEEWTPFAMLAKNSYTTSLDRCAELRAMLSEDEWLAYSMELIRLQPDCGLVRAGANATAEQHCRAWLAAKGVQG